MNPHYGPVHRKYRRKHRPLPRIDRDNLSLLMRAFAALYPVYVLLRLGEDPYSDHTLTLVVIALAAMTLGQLKQLARMLLR